MKSKWGSTLVAISVLVFFTSRLLAETTQTETEKRKSNMAKKIEPLEPSGVSKIFAGFDFQAHQLTPKEFIEKSKAKGVVILDLRNEVDFKRGHIKSAINLNLDASIEALEKLIPSKDTVILSYCSNSFYPTRMMSLTSTLVPQIYQLGYKNIYFLQDLYRSANENMNLQSEMGWIDLPTKK